MLRLVCLPEGQLELQTPQLIHLSESAATLLILSMALYEAVLSFMFHPSVERVLPIMINLPQSEDDLHIFVLIIQDFSVFMLTISYFECLLKVVFFRFLTIV